MVIDAGEFTRLPRERYPDDGLIALADPSDMSEAHVRRLTQYVKAGGRVWWSLGTRARSERGRLNELLRPLGVEIGEAGPAPGIGSVDARRPGRLLARCPFNGVPHRGRPGARRPRRIPRRDTSQAVRDVAERNIILGPRRRLGRRALRRGPGAVVEVPSGRGKFVFVGADFDPTGNDWLRSPGFPIFVRELFRWSAARPGLVGPCGTTIEIPTPNFPAGSALSLMALDGQYEFDARGNTGPTKARPLAFHSSRGGRIC